MTANSEKPTKRSITQMRDASPPVGFLVPGLGGPGLAFIPFLLCGFHLFGVMLTMLFGLVFLTLFVAHVVAPS